MYGITLRAIILRCVRHSLLMIQILFFSVRRPNRAAAKGSGKHKEI